MADGMACQGGLNSKLAETQVGALVAAYAWRTLTNGMYLTKTIS